MASTRFDRNVRIAFKKDFIVSVSDLGNGMSSILRPPVASAWLQVYCVGPPMLS